MIWVAGVLIVIALSILSLALTGNYPIAKWGSVLTGIGALFIIYQIQQRSDQFTKEFEDGLTKEYRQIVDDAPTLAFLGKTREQIGFAGYEENQYKFDDAIYRYLDLTNQQIHLRREGRVSRSTWKEWDEGMREHLKQPEIARTLHEVNQTIDEDYDLESSRHFSGVCTYLEHLDNQMRDPKTWEIPPWDLGAHVTYFCVLIRGDTIIHKSKNNSDWESCEWVSRASWSKKLDSNTDDSD
jgi:hypothetical protein